MDNFIINDQIVSLLPGNLKRKNFLILFYSVFDRVYELCSGQQTMQSKASCAVERPHPYQIWFEKNKNMFKEEKSVIVMIVLLICQFIMGFAY
jgi:hypothetical protein